MTTNQPPALTNAPRLKFSIWWLIGICALLFGALLIFAASRNEPVSPIARHNTWRPRITGLRFEHFDAAAQGVLYDLGARPTNLTKFASTENTNNVQCAWERDSTTCTLPISAATKRVLKYLRTHPTVLTAPKAGS